MKVLYVGVVGYNPPTRFDEDKARHLLNNAFDNIIADYPNLNEIWVVSGYTDVGMQAIAYRVARERNRNEEFCTWQTMGIACARAQEHPLSEVDEGKIVGAEWGDESETFLAAIDVIVRVGGGEQRLRETEAFASMHGNDKVYAYELAAL